MRSALLLTVFLFISENIAHIPLMLSGIFKHNHRCLMVHDVVIGHANTLA
jgi:hypothetical protein